MNQCAICLNENYMSVLVPYFKLTESGRPIKTELESQTQILPLCAFHVPYAQLGLIIGTDKGARIRLINNFDMLERMSIEELKIYSKDLIEQEEKIQIEAMISGKKLMQYSERMKSAKTKEEKFKLVREFMEGNK